MSKRLSFVLRHQPASVGITLDAAGWVGVGDLLRALAAHGLRLTREDLDAVVAHLSADVATARVVGGRRGSAVVLRVDAARLATDGARLSVSAEDVWLVDAVPPAYPLVTDREQE